MIYSIFKKIPLVFLFFNINASERYECKDFDNKLIRLYNKYDNNTATAIWKHIYGKEERDNLKGKIVKRRIIDSHNKFNFPLITSYGEIDNYDKAYITLAFKCQDVRDYRHHAGVVIEFLDENNKIQSLYYDLASKEAANGERVNQNKDSGSASGGHGEYKVRRFHADDIIDKFLWSPIAPHHKVEYYGYKSYSIDKYKLSSLKKRLDCDYFKDVFPYTFTGKYNHNCITYVAQVLQDAGVINQTFRIMYYDAHWIMDLVNENEILKGKTFKTYTFHEEKNENNKQIDVYAASDEMQERVIQYILALVVNGNSASDSITVPYIIAAELQARLRARAS